MAADDRELWERISPGDIRSFDGFYQECAPRLLNFLRQMMGSQQAAEDITQDAFLQLWRRPNGFDPTEGPSRLPLWHRKKTGRRMAQAQLSCLGWKTGRRCGRDCGDIFRYG